MRRGFRCATKLRSQQHSWDAGGAPSNRHFASSSASRSPPAFRFIRMTSSSAATRQAGHHERSAHRSHPTHKDAPQQGQGAPAATAQPSLAWTYNLARTYPKLLAIRKVRIAAGTWVGPKYAPVPHGDWEVTGSLTSFQKDVLHLLTSATASSTATGAAAARPSRVRRRAFTNGKSMSASRLLHAS